MSFNGWLRRLVYGEDTRQGRNLFLRLPAGVTGTTWQGTGFEEPPAEVVVLDEASLPWELREDEVATAVSHSERFIDDDDVVRRDEDSEVT